ITSDGDDSDSNGDDIPLSDGKTRGLSTPFANPDLISHLNIQCIII
ncbi:18416_t:CDS:1, partial [Entrophospora sp. SA101]